MLDEALGLLPARDTRFVKVLELMLAEAVMAPTWPGVRVSRWKFAGCQAG